MFALAQTDTLFIAPDFKEVKANSYFNYFNTSTELSVDSAVQVFQQHSSSVQQLNKINFGSINGYYWLQLFLKNTSGKDQNLFVEIHSPHIYRIAFHKIEPDTIYSLSETGIRYNFYQRPTKTRFFDFPITLKKGETATVLLMVYHLNSLSLPINVISQSSFHQNNYTENIIWGYWFGFLSFCALFALIASMLLRNSIFLWYFFYITSAALYGFTDQGYSFQFIFPGLADTEATVIIQLAMYGFIFLVKLSQGLLDTKKYLPTVHKILNGLFYFVLTLILSAYVAPRLMFKLSPIVLPTVNLVVLFGLILLAFSGIKALFTNRIIAIFFLVAYGTLVAAAVFGILNYGFGLFQYSGPNPILIAYFFEAMLLSAALVILFRQVQKEQLHLTLELNDQQKKMYKHYIDGIEKERSRIAGELHDDVGSKLSNLKRLLETHSEESLKTAEQIDRLIVNVRQISHDLAPPLAHLAGVETLLENLIADTRRSTGIDIKFQAYDHSDRLTPPQIQQVYRIVQEALNNVAKHAEATRVDVQLFEQPGELNIIIEDNGKGFDVTAQEKGFGLNQMKIRTESLGGHIEINSKPGNGSFILIKIPLAS